MEDKVRFRARFSDSDIDTGSSEYAVDTILDDDHDHNIYFQAAYEKLTKTLQEVLDEREKILMEKVTVHINAKCHDLAATVDDKENFYMGYYPRDSYSFVALYSPVNNPSLFYFGLFVFLLQIAFQILLFLSIVVPDLSSSEYIDGSDPVFPGVVEPIVKIVQILSIVAHVMIADCSMDDLITAINLFPNINKAKHDDPLSGLVLSSCLRFIQGLTANVATFILIFTSLTAKEVVLNFAAINFISFLDNAGFSSALKGYFGDKMQNIALEVKKKRLPCCITNKKYRFLQNCVVILSMLFAMTAAGAFFVLVPQTSGSFLTNDFRLEFGVGAGLEKYNGCYEMEELSLSKRLGGARPIYTNHENEARFTYCKTDMKWHLFEAYYGDGCKYGINDQILAYSSRSFSFDIKTIFSDPWFSSSGTPLEADFVISGVGVEEGCGKRTGDGTCDTVLNIAEFEYDGGDCCASTCNHPLCGLGTITEAFDSTLRSLGDGYQDCSDPDMVKISITVQDVIREGEYYQYGRIVNSTPPLMKLECDGVNHLALSVQEGMENKTELIKVQDGGMCKVFLKAGHKVNFTIAMDGNTSDITIFNGVINNGTHDGIMRFQVLPKCYFEKLSGHINFSTFYVDNTTPQRRVINGFLTGANTSNSDCGNPFFIERYALAVTYLSAKYPRFDNASSIELTDEISDEIMSDEISQMILNEPLCQFVACSSGHITALDWANRTFLGTIATELALLTELRRLDLAYNQLRGTVPTELGILSNLEELYLYFNQINGTIPSELGSLSNLETLDLTFNKIQGTIPTNFGMLPTLISLILESNQLSGAIPAEVGNMSKLERLWLLGNKLNGPIPTELGTLSNLETIWFDNNQLNGAIPTQLGNLSNLQGLWLSDNQLNGSIPTNFGTLSNLKFIRLDHNKLKGRIPTDLGNLSNLQELWLNDNNLNGNVPTNFGTLSKLQNLQLDENNLTGNIDNIFCDQVEQKSTIRVDSEKVVCSCCVASGTPTISPSPTTTSSPTREACPEVTEGGCAVCGEGKCVRNLDAEVEIPGTYVGPCGVGEKFGLEGVLTPKQCAALASLTKAMAICECG